MGTGLGPNPHPRKIAAPAVFLDKDGTLLADVPYNVDPARMRLLPGVLEGLRLLQEAGYRLIVVTNQSGVARGYFAEEALDAVKRRLKELLAAAGVRLTAFYYCPHHPEAVVARYAEPCTCRKPLPGLLLRAATDHHVDLHGSWVIGDTADDTGAGRLAGCRTVLIAPSPDSPDARIRPDYIARTFEEAARAVLGTAVPAGTEGGA
jgi:histidinol-phosphate phosphatase family protein